MRTRYVAGWVGGWEGDEHRQTCEVYEREDKPVATGLLDANGVMIYRVMERDPVGFVLRKRGQ